MSWSVKIDSTGVCATQKTVSELYDMEIHQKISVLNQKFQTMVKRSIDQKLRLRIFDARFWRIETGVVVKNRKGLSGVEGGGKVSVTSGKKKVSVRKENDAVSVTKPELTAATPSETTVSRGRSVSRKKSVRGKSNHGSIFDNHADIVWEVLVRERLVNIGIRPSAKSIKMKWVVRLETSVCFRHYKVDEQPN